MAEIDWTNTKVNFVNKALSNLKEILEKADLTPLMKYDVLRELKILADMLHNIPRKAAIKPYESMKQLLKHYD